MLWEIQLPRESLKYKHYQEQTDLSYKDLPNWETIFQTLNF